MNPLDALIGVVDLMNGHAVHAIAGQRDFYLPLQLSGQAPGDAVALLRRYYSLGLRRFYLADLNAICGLESQQQAIAGWLNSLQVAAPETIEVYLDEGAGWTRYDAPCPLRRVISSEACRSPKDWSKAAAAIDPDHLVLGLDLRGANVRSANCHEPQNCDLLENVRPWLAAARTKGCYQAIALDLQFVGAEQGVGIASACQTLADYEPDFQWLSGGGVRTAQDIQRLRDAGCRRVLVGTALHHDSQANLLVEALRSFP